MFALSKPLFLSAFLAVSDLLFGSTYAFVLPLPNSHPALPFVSTEYRRPSPSSLSETSAAEQEVCPVSESLSMTLKKASKTLAVVLEVDLTSQSLTSSDIDTLSMQLRKAQVSALATKDWNVATKLMEEQATAQGGFPGPCPVLYTGDDDDVDANQVDGVVMVPSSSSEQSPPTLNAISKVSTVKDVQATTSNAFWVTADVSQDVLEAIPEGSIILASLESMQDDNTELEVAKDLRERGVTAIVLENAIVGDNEDMEYATFAVQGMTKKRSSTFNMSGLTGSTNGHFGGVASSTAKTWLRKKRQQEE